MKFAKGSVYYYFVLEGIFVALWSVYLPILQVQLGSDQNLALAILLSNIGNAVAAPLASKLLSTVGSRTSVTVGAVLFGLALPLVPLSPSPFLSHICALWFGMTVGILDVSMNSCGILVENAEACSLFGLFHGTYSVSAAIGSVGGNWLVQLGQCSISFTIIGIASVFFSSWAFVEMFDHNEEILLKAVDKSHDGMYSSKSSNSSIFCNKTILSYCTIVFLAALGETSLVTWSILYAQRYISNEPSVQTTGFTCFQVCMAVGRFSTDCLRRLYGRRRIVQLSGVLAMTGLSLAVAAPSLGAFNSSVVLGVACVGFAATGLGLSTLIPTMFSSAGHLPHSDALAAVACAGYVGSLASGPFIAAVLLLCSSSLRAALTALAACLSLISVCSALMVDEGDVSASPVTGSGAPGAAAALSGHCDHFISAIVSDKAE